jgi:hypothetical protein
MPNEYVLVELIENPLVQRQMSQRSLALNNKWRPVASDSKTITAPVTEKKNVEPVVAGEFVNPTIEPSEPSGVIAGLREQYLAKYGKKADGRWNIKKLAEEINKTPEA